MKVTTLDKAKVSLVTQHPFFASILMKRLHRGRRSIASECFDTSQANCSVDPLRP